MLKTRAVLMAMSALLFESSWGFTGPHGVPGMLVSGHATSVWNRAIQLVSQTDGECTSDQQGNAETQFVVSTCDQSFAFTPSSDTEQISHMDTDWQNNATWFLLSPDEFAATRFSPSQPMRPFHIRSVAFVPERATGSDAVLFFVAMDQAGYPGQHVFVGSIPVGIVNQFSGEVLHITFAEDAYFTGDFHFGVGTASASGDSLAVFADTGGGDATHSLVYIDGTWYTMPDFGHSNSWIMRAQIEYQIGVDEKPVQDVLQAVVSPNPFRTMTVLRYDLVTDASVEVVVFDIGGRRVKELYRGPQEQGRHALTWDGTTVLGTPAAPGVYVCMLFAGGRDRVHKTVLLE